MADVFGAVKIEIRYDKDLGMYTLKVTPPKPNGPFVFGVSKEQLEKLRTTLTRLLGD
jgi:hypothetical protein